MSFSIFSFFFFFFFNATATTEIYTLSLHDALPIWGYDRIVGALANLGHVVSDQTVGNILRRYGIQPAPKRSQSTTWKDFIASHLAVLAGTDFFTVEVGGDEILP